MNCRSDYRRFQFGIADLLAVAAIVAILASFGQLPVSLLHAIPLLSVVYAAKLRILDFGVRPWTASSLYLLVVICLLPYLYGRVTIDWDNPFVSPLANWLGGPVAAFTVPTASFVYDVGTRKRPSVRFYVLRSLIEAVILVPLWTFIWVWFEFLVLGWIWV